MRQSCTIPVTIEKQQSVTSVRHVAMTDD